MCGSAIIFNFIALTTASKSRRLTVDLLWNTDLPRNCTNYYSKPLLSQVVDLDDDFEADFRGFKDFSDDEVVAGDFQPFAFTASKKSPFSLESEVRLSSWTKGLCFIICACLVGKMSTLEKMLRSLFLLFM